MDGNGRWAGRRGLPAPTGTPRARRTSPAWCASPCSRDIGWLTVFGFSTENWIRPRAEVRHILGLHAQAVRPGRRAQRAERAHPVDRPPVRHPDARTPKYVQRAIRKAIADTAGNTGMLLTVAFDYGARQELIDAVAPDPRRGRATSRPTPSPTHLYLPELPPVDVLVRTCGERRVSNFLLWQSAGAAIHFTDKPWPEFDAAELDAALALVARPGPDARCVATLAAVTAPAARRRGPARPAARWPSSSPPPSTRGRHLVVQAGTGTGKTLAYLVPAIASGRARRRGHGDQGAAGPARRQGPAVPRRRRCDVAVRLGGAQGAQQLRLPAAAARDARRRRTASSSWRAWRRRPATRSRASPSGPATTDTGDGAELDWSPSRRGVARRSASAATSARAPTAARSATPCFAEQARRRAAAADVVVVNTHLYGLHVGSGGVILPEHDVVVFDEAHVLEDVMSDTVGVAAGAGPVRHARRRRCGGSSTTPRSSAA